MGILKSLYRRKHPDVPEEQIPRWYKISIFDGVKKIWRKWMSAVFIPTVPFNGMRVWLYKSIGYKIGRGAFIGMRCYLDDLCYDKIVIGQNVTISYGVYFACHGHKQGHNKIVIGDGAYIGMRASIIAPQDIEIGEKAIIGAQSLVNKSIPAGKIAVGVPCRILEK